jgi:hypothetical protein
MTDSPASWDEFPNGRFGDARSPAYGDLDGWGVSLKLTPSEALQKWGAPASNADISQLFVRYLQGTLKAVPWSDEPLRSETNDILPYLVRLNTEKDWWTVGSQPAVDGAPSEDETYGFGPAGGYIYQKSFVEFFCSYDDVMRIQEKANRVEQESRKRKVTFYAGNTESESKSLITNMQTGDANAVTWGVFPGKEIVTTTLIEEMSFTAWKVSAGFCLSFQNHTESLVVVTFAGGSVLDMDRMGASVPSKDRHSRSIIEFGERPMACQCSTSRLQRFKWSVGFPAERVESRPPVISCTVKNFVAFASQTKLLCYIFYVCGLLSTTDVHISRVFVLSILILLAFRSWTGWIVKGALSSRPSFTCGIAISFISWICEDVVILVEVLHGICWIVAFIITVNVARCIRYLSV